MQREQTRKATDQVSLVVLHAGRPNQVVLFTPPVSKTPEKVVRKETVNRIPDDVYVDGLLYPKPEKERHILIHLWMNDN